ncbi:tetratricopeptide repeat protein [Patescibacteria group bacterium]|nr:MAG: tetratricopeptide repeat protein [Patescibacteria group bacterium]
MDSEQTTSDEKATSQLSKLSLEKISYLVLGVFALILPFFHIPSRLFNISLSKSFLLALAILSAAILYLVTLIREGRLSFQKNLLALSLILVPAIALFSAIVNGARSVMIFGFIFELGTVVSVFLGFLLLYLTGQLFRSKERIFYAYLGFFISFAVIALYHIIRFVFGPSLLSFGTLTLQINNLIGNWNDLTVFFAAATLLSLTTLEMVRLNRLLSIVLSVIFVLSLAFLAVVNFSTIWVVLGVFALILFLYIISFDRFVQSRSPASAAGEAGEREVVFRRKISYRSLAVVLICLFFIIFGKSTGTPVADFFGIANIEVRPSWTSTLSVAGKVLKESPLVGSGPNTFTSDWLQHKPAGINETLFWNTDFVYGIGFIPTTLVTTGVLGLFSWLFFLAAVLYFGVRAVFFTFPDLLSRYLITSSLLLSLFFWTAAFVYVPSIVNIFLAFFFTGLFAASLYREGVVRENTVLLSIYPKVSFLSTLLLVVLIIGLLTLGFRTMTNLFSFVSFQKSLFALNTKGDLDEAERQMSRALNRGPFDLYSRALAELYFIRLSNIIAQPVTATSVEEFRTVLAKSIESGQKAVSGDPKNYQNWLTLARIYSSLVPPTVGIPGAYESAKTSYEEALKVNPHSPLIYLELSSLEAARGDLEAARNYVDKALAEKPNYADAHFFVARIEITRGNITQAISSLETTVLLSPGNPGLFFQLGILKYSIADYNGAIEALERAVGLVPVYANAKYFLGLSYARTGRGDEAIVQFEGVEKTNPDNQEVKNILTNLRASRDPFANVKPPLDRSPERRAKPPIEETGN